LNEELYKKVDLWFEDHREQMLSDVVRLLRIPSISDPSGPCHPFGQGCHDALEEMLLIGREHGFYTENHEYYVGSIGLEKKDYKNTIGFWNHLDVVPVGNNWEYAPFDPVLLDHFLIGRGSQDNKGPAIGILYMMKCIRELQIPMKHELCLFVGCDEERGMQDIEYYTNRYHVPKLNMIADSGFPVCYGEKGILDGRMISKYKVSGRILDLYGGHAINMIPDIAVAVLERTAELEKELIDSNTSLEITRHADRIELTARGTSKHSAFPEGSTNAIHELCHSLSQLSCLDVEDLRLLRSVSAMSAEYYGEAFDISYRDDVSGPTTCAATILKLEDRKISLTLNIRYAITADVDKLFSCMTVHAQQAGFVWKLERNSKPNYFSRQHPAVELLTNTYNEMTGEKKEPFTMGGGTYARKLPNAFAYGIGGLAVDEWDKTVSEKLFLPGHGGAHEPDEGLNIRLFLKAMKIYTMSVAALNDCML